MYLLTRTGLQDIREFVSYVSHGREPSTLLSLRIRVDLIVIISQILAARYRYRLTVKAAKHSLAPLATWTLSTTVELSQIGNLCPLSYRILPHHRIMSSSN